MFSRLRALLIVFIGLRRDSFMLHYFGRTCRGSLAMASFLWDELRFFGRFGRIVYHGGGVAIVGLPPNDQFPPSQISPLSRLLIRWLPSDERGAWSHAYPLREFLPDGPFITLPYISVLPWCRRRGVARRLIGMVRSHSPLPLVVETGSSLMLDVLTRYGFDVIGTADLSQQLRVYLMRGDPDPR